MLVAHRSAEFIKILKLLEGLLAREDLPENDAEADKVSERSSLRTRHAPVNICLLVERLAHHHLRSHPERRALRALLSVLQILSALLDLLMMGV